MIKEADNFRGLSAVDCYWISFERRQIISIIENEVLVKDDSDKHEDDCFVHVLDRSTIFPKL